MKKIYIKSALLFGMAIGIPLTVLRGISFMTKGTASMLMVISTGLLVGLLSGILFTFLIALFVKWQTIGFKKKREEMAKEYDIVYDDGANHFVGKEGVGGWLFLTMDHLFFQSHNFNVQNHELMIPLHAIKSVSVCKLLFIFDTGLIIERNNHKMEKFSVANPAKWAEIIEQTKKNLESSDPDQ